jgi:IS5 family transposase
LGGRPNFDGILMLKMLVLQQWYGLTDQELEKQVADRLSFLSFLGFPERIPDYSTVWLFRERLIKSGKMKKVWKELQRQLDVKGLDPKKIVAQDATFITADHGASEPSKPRGHCSHDKEVEGRNMDHEAQPIVYRVQAARED